MDTLPDLHSTLGDYVTDLRVCGYELLARAWSTLTACRYEDARILYLCDVRHLDLASIVAMFERSGYERAAPIVFNGQQTARGFIRGYLAGLHEAGVTRTGIVGNTVAPRTSRHWPAREDAKRAARRE